MLRKLFLLTLSVLPFSTYGWGPLGHQAVAKIAQDVLSVQAQSVVNTLIPNGNMTAVATWADEVRILPEFKWSAPLHFINTPSWTCNYDRQRDCYSELTGEYLMCVDGAIQNFTTRLMTNPTPDDLKFLIHFVGDIHQPLHCGFGPDRGGNTIQVELLTHKDNLHSVWDSGIIELTLKNKFGNSWSNWIEYLEDNFQPPGNLTCDYKNGVCGQEWGNESTKLACQVAYTNVDGTHIVNKTHLLQSYVDSRMETINTQIIKGALRLAFILNEIFA